ncbi:MAG: 3-isopropylmalate dehydratase large subunit [Candidatus Azobacteroides sp.]|nr:3-isopropylmalate dehydratase large subunit [Candidatus Azobacteroides sp.]
MAKTLFDKIWDAHTVTQVENGPTQLYIDRHLCHEVTSPQAFDGLRRRGLKVFRPGKTTATTDHNIPTENQDLPIKDQVSRFQVDTLTKNCEEFGITLYGLGNEKNGVVHVMGPENGLTQPGMTIVCGDSHTSTHGAFGAVAFGVGTSEVEMVLASQCVLQSRPKTMRITFEGKLNPFVSSKDIALYMISKLTTGGATGYFVEYAGEAIRNLSMEARMTLCNLSIEMGARGGLIAPDETTFEYVKGREFAPQGADWDKASAYWKTLKTDEGAKFDKEITFNAGEIEPMITYGTNPGMGMPITGTIPSPESIGEAGRISFQRSMEYMGFKPGEKMSGKPVDYVFLGSCTNGRIEDFRAFANFVKGKKKAGNVTVWLVPGSRRVEKQIREEGLDKILNEAGFVLRQPGCSACLAMNDDKVPAGKYSVSTSNRNFEGRQGPGARTLLASPLVAAAAAVTGKITDPREL